MAAGYWTQKRKFDAGYVHTALCPHCGRLNQDDYHLMWGCSELGLSPDPAIQDSQWLLGAAFQGHTTTPCWWLRGLTPKAFTFDPKLPEGWIKDIGAPGLGRTGHIDPHMPIVLGGNIPPTPGYAGAAFRGSNI